MSSPEGGRKRPFWGELAQTVGLFACVGLLQTLCFDVVPSVWLPWISWAPLVWLAVHSRWSLRRRLLAAWACGTVFWIVNVSWIAHTIGLHGGLPRWVGAALLTLLALYMGLYWVGFVTLGTLLRGRAREVGFWNRLMQAGALAGVWVVLEIAREWVFTGFPWSPLGESLVRVPGALDAAPWLGSRGLSLLVLLVNAVVAQTVVDEVGGRQRSRALLVTVVAGTCLVLGVAFLGGAESKQDSILEARDSALGADSLPVRIVQPNVPIAPPATEVVENYQRLLRLSECGALDELIVWPESAAYPFSWQQASLRRDVLSAVGTRCALLFNSAVRVEKPDRSIGYTNTAMLATLSPDASSELMLQSYDKIHLVPYGEFIPLKELLPFVGQLARNVGEFERGEQFSLLRWRDAVLGVSICFEVLFPKEVAERVRDGATALLTLTNDAWFGNTRAPHQHLVSARFRAAENQRPMVFAAVTGTSAAIDTSGRVVKSLPVGVVGTLEVDLIRDLGHRVADPGLPTTIYTRYPWLADVLALLLFGSGLVHQRWRSKAMPTRPQ